MDSIRNAVVQQKQRSTSSRDIEPVVLDGVDPEEMTDMSSDRTMRVKPGMTGRSIRTVTQTDSIPRQGFSTSSSSPDIHSEFRRSSLFSESIKEEPCLEDDDGTCNQVSGSLSTINIPRSIVIDFSSLKDL